MIDVAYKCRCMSREAGLHVRDFNPGETVQQWMEGPLRMSVSLDHSKRAPRCDMLITEYVALPFELDKAPVKKIILQ